VSIENLVTTGVLFGHSLSLNDIQRAYPECSSYNPRRFAGLYFVVSSKQCPELTHLLPAKRQKRQTGGGGRSGKAHAKRADFKPTSVAADVAAPGDAAGAAATTAATTAEERSTASTHVPSRKRKRKQKDSARQEEEEEEAEEEKQQQQQQQREPKESVQTNRPRRTIGFTPRIAWPSSISTVPNTKPAASRQVVTEIMFGDRLAGKDPEHLPRVLGTSIFDSGSCLTIGKSTVRASRIVYRFLAQTFHHYDDPTRPTRREHIHRYRLQRFQAEQRRRESQLACFDVSRQVLQRQSAAAAPEPQSLQPQHEPMMVMTKMTTTTGPPKEMSPNSVNTNLGYQQQNQPQPQQQQQRQQQQHEAQQEYYDRPYQHHDPIGMQELQREVNNGFQQQEKQQKEEEEARNHAFAKPLLWIPAEENAESEDDWIHLGQQIDQMELDTEKHEELPDDFWDDLFF